MNDSQQNIDRHKIAACMMKAILEVYPLKVSFRHILELWRGKSRLEDKYIYANETLAFYTALSILENYKDYCIDGTNGEVHPSIKIPKTYNESDYLFNTYIDLYFGKREKKINVLSFANIFFLLERLSSSPQK